MKKANSKKTGGPFTVSQGRLDKFSMVLENVEVFDGNSLKCKLNMHEVCRLH